MKKTIALFAALLLHGWAHAQVQSQTQVGVPPALEVQRLAPQLVLFAGGDVNFNNLVNGLAFGVPVTLTTPLQTGLTEVVTFTPAGAMTPLAIAQLLEAARQSLISRGVVAPTAQQITTALAGGTLTTTAGTTQLQPLITTVTPVGTATPSNTPSLLQSGALRNTSDSLLPRGISDTPPAFSGTSLTPRAPLLTAAPTTSAPLGAATGSSTPTAGGIRPVR